MTASTVKSVNVTNIENNPISALNRVNGIKKVIFDKKAVATTSIDEINDAIMFCPIPSNAVITSIKILNDDLDSHATPTLAVDCGLYYSGIGAGQIAAGKVSGDVIDQDAFASAITTLQAANTSGVEIRFEAGAGTAGDIVDLYKEAWQIGALSSDIGGILYIGLKVTTVAATAAAGDIVMVVEYI